MYSEASPITSTSKATTLPAGRGRAAARSPGVGALAREHAVDITFRKDSLPGKLASEAQASAGSINNDVQQAQSGQGIAHHHLQLHAGLPVAQLPWSTTRGHGRPMTRSPSKRRYGQLPAERHFDTHLDGLGASRVSWKAKSAGKRCMFRFTAWLSTLTVAPYRAANSESRMTGVRAAQ